MTLLERVKELCSENKVSQRTVEKECGLSNGSITKWKKSKGGEKTKTKNEKVQQMTELWKQLELVKLACTCLFTTLLY